MIALIAAVIASNVGPILSLSVGAGLLFGLVLDARAEDAEDRALSEADPDELIPPPRDGGGR
jgi:hypothetical protein